MALALPFQSPKWGLHAITIHPWPSPFPLGRGPRSGTGPNTEAGRGVRLCQAGETQGPSAISGILQIAWLQKPQKRGVLRNCWAEEPRVACKVTDSLGAQRIEVRRSRRTGTRSAVQGLSLWAGSSGKVEQHRCDPNGSAQHPAQAISRDVFGAHFGDAQQRECPKWLNHVGKLIAVGHRHDQRPG